MVWEVIGLIQPPRGSFTFDAENYNTYLLPGDVGSHWSEEEQLQFLTQIQELAARHHRGSMDAAFEDWAQTADPDELELGRKVMWEYAHIKV